jgi:large subunit ribosomal protein L1
VSKRHGKKYIEAAKKVEAALAANGNGGFATEEAVALAKNTSISKFDATVEAHIRLGVDPRHAEQMVRGSVVLPNGTGKKVRVAVFAVGDRARADFVGGEDLVKKVSEGWTDFDAAVATPDMMSRVGPLGKILGPRGLMPNPKSGTVTQDVARAVREVKGGKVEFRTDKFGIVHAPIGKVSFDQQQLHQNLTALVDALIRNKPSTSKGQYLRTFYLAATQGPSVPVDVKEAAKLELDGFVLAAQGRESFRDRLFRELDRIRIVRVSLAHLQRLPEAVQRLVVLARIHVRGADIVQERSQPVVDLRIGAGFGDPGSFLGPRQHPLAIRRGKRRHVGGVGGEELLARIACCLESRLE